MEEDLFRSEEEYEQQKAAPQPKEKKKSDVEITEIISETTKAVKLPDGTVTSDFLEVLVWLCNRVCRIEKAVA